MSAIALLTIALTTHPKKIMKLIPAGCRVARSAALAFLEVSRRKADDGRRVAKAEDSLQHVDVSALQAELGDALAAQAAIAREMKALELAPIAQR